MSPRSTQVSRLRAVIFIFPPSRIQKFKTSRTQISHIGMLDVHAHRVPCHFNATSFSPAFIVETLQLFYILRVGIHIQSMPKYFSLLCIIRHTNKKLNRLTSNIKHQTTFTSCCRVQLFSVIVCMSMSQH